MAASKLALIQGFLLASPFLLISPPAAAGPREPTGHHSPPRALVPVTRPSLRGLHPLVSLALSKPAAYTPSHELDVARAAYSSALDHPQASGAEIARETDATPMRDDVVRSVTRY